MGNLSKKWVKNVKEIAKTSGYDLDSIEVTSLFMRRVTGYAWLETHDRLMDEYFKREEQRLGGLPPVKEQNEESVKIMEDSVNGTIKPTKKEVIDAIKEYEDHLRYLPD